jgi:toxin ParE1/3/4
MDYQVRWSPAALDDVDSIASYISRDSELYAGAVVEKILETAGGLIDFPFSGRIVPELNIDSLREKIIYSYRLVYRIEDDMITVAAVIHGKQLFDPFLDRVKPG